MNAPRAPAGRMKNGALGVRSDGVERWLRETRGLIIFEDPFPPFPLSLSASLSVPFNVGRRRGSILQE